MYERLPFVTVEEQKVMPRVQQTEDRFKKKKFGKAPAPHRPAPRGQPGPSTVIRFGETLRSCCYFFSVSRAVYSRRYRAGMPSSAVPTLRGEQMLKGEAKDARREEVAIEEATADAMMRFADMDTNGDMTLDFEEFLAMQTKTVRAQYSDEEIREWFNTADMDDSGTLTISEWFVWTLDHMATKHGVDSIERMFKKYDKDGTGQLDTREFDKLAATNGFGAGANSIFRELDDDDSGTVSYQEIIDKMRDRKEELSGNTQQMLAQVMWAEHAEGEAVVKEQIDTTGWVINAKTVEGVKAQMQELVAKHGVAVGDVLRLLDVDMGGQREVDDLEFFQGLKKHFGFKGSFLLAVDVFRSIDTDGMHAAVQQLERSGCSTFCLLHVVLTRLLVPRRALACRRLWRHQL